MNFSLPTPTIEQEEILERVKNRENLLVIAGAGTGKTTCLLFIYRALLERFNPGEIAAITFTEKAAGELRDGIRTLLLSECNERSQSASLRDATSALIALSDAPIGTIHSFCGRIAREFPDFSGLPPEFKVLDEAGASFFLNRALTEFINEHLSADPVSEDFLQLLWYKNDHPAGVRDLIRRVFTVMRQKHLSQDDLETVYCRQNSEKLSEPGSEGGAQGAQLSGHALGDIVLRYTEQFRDYYRRQRFGSGFVDFEDLLEGAYRVVSDDELAKEVSARYRVVLVDEFQDTDRLQAAIVERLKAFGSQVILVGDPLQSIYRFRGADVQVFNDLIQNARSKGFCVCTLSLNFRSGQPILNFVNETVSRAQEPVFLLETRKTRRRKSKESEPAERVPLLPAREYKPLTASDTSKPGVVVVFPLVQTARLDAMREKEAEILPAQCRWISAEYGIPVGQIAVLFRKFTHIDIYMRCLDEAGLPYFAHSGGGLFATQEVMDVLSLLRWIADPADRIAEAAVLRSLFCGLDDASLMAWFSPQKVSDSFRPSREVWNRAHQVTDLVGHMRARALTTSPALLVQELLSETNFAARVLRLPGGVRRAANLSAFVDRLFQLEAQLGWTFREMVEFLSRLSEDDSGTSPPPLDIEDPRTVKLLTVHSAKGLEFEAVILADTLGSVASVPGPDYDPDSRLFLIDTPDAEADTRYKQAKVNLAYQDFQENLRLLYVAMTRAKRVLAVNWYYRHNKITLKPDAPDDFSRLISLLHGERVTEGNPGSEVTFQIREESKALVRIVSNLPAVAEEITSEPASWEGVDLVERLSRGVRLEESALLAATEAAGPRGESFRTDADRRLGEALHSALEVWHPEADLSAVWVTIAAEYGLSESDTRRGLGFLRLFSQHEVADWLRRFRCNRELDLFGKWQGRWVSGRADLVVYAPDEVRLVDYKLSVSKEDEAVYFEQVRIYAQLLSRNFPNTPVKGYIYDLSRGILIAVASDERSPEESRL